RLGRDETRTPGERRLEQHLVASLLDDVELRADPSEVHAQRVWRDPEPLRERVAVKTLTVAGELLHLAQDPDLPPGEAHRAQTERGLVERRGARTFASVGLRALLCGFGARPDRTAERLRLRVTLRGSPFFAVTIARTKSRNCSSSGSPFPARVRMRSATSASLRSSAMWP